jgi:hypothetical protein
MKDSCEHVVAPSVLWRFNDSDGSLWVGRRQLHYKSDSTQPHMVSMSRDDLQDAARSFWKMGYNAHAAEVRVNLRNIAIKFDPDSNYLPYDLIEVQEPQPWWHKSLMGIGAGVIGSIFLLVAIVAIGAMMDAYQ